jgi:hypothetical protein
MRYPSYYSYGVLEPFAVLLHKRVTLVFRDTIYVIIIHYS